MSEDRNIKLGLSLDASSVKADLDPAKQAVKDFAQTFNDLGSSSDREVKKMEAAVKRAAIQVASSGRSASEALQIKAEINGLDGAALAPKIAALKRLEAAANQAGGVGANSLDKIGISAKQTAFALRGVPAQFTDIVTSLQGGQAPLTVFLQQGGQLKDMFGGAGNAARALGGYVLGLVNPFSVAAVAVGGLAIAYELGAKEAREYAKALIISGNQTGATVGQLSDQAKAIGAVTGSQRGAAAALVEFAASGKVGAESLDKFTQAALRFEKATGTAIADTVKAFEELGKAPADAAVKLNDKYNFLTASVYRQIKALEDQGRATDAAKLAQNEFADTLASRATQIIDNTGLIEKGWSGVKRAINGAVDALLDLGRVSSPSDQLKNIDSQISALEARKLVGSSDLRKSSAFGGSSPNDPRLSAQIEALKQQAAYISENERIEKRSAATAAEKKRILDATVATEKLIEGSMTNQQRLAQELVKNRNAFLALGVPESDLKNNKDFQAVNTATRKKYNETTGQSEVADIKAKTLAQREYFALLEEKGKLADDLTEGQKLVIKIQQELKTSILGVARAQKERALASAQELATVDLLIQGEKKRIAAVEKSRLEYLALTETVDKAAEAIRQQAIDLEAANASTGKSKTAIEIDRLKELQKYLKDVEPKNDLEEKYVATVQRKAQAQERYVAALKGSDLKELTSQQTEYARQLDEQAKLYQDELALTGLSRVEREKILAVRKSELDYAKQIAEINKSLLDDDEKASLRATAEDNRKKAGATAVAKVIQDEYQKMSQSVGQTLTDALSTAFDKGKGFGLGLRDALVKTFKELVLRPTISSFVTPVAGAFTGALGFSGNANAAGGGGASEIYDAISGGFSKLSETATQYFSNFATSSAGQSLGLSSGAAGGAPTMTQAASSMATAAGSIAGSIGGFLAGEALRKGVSGGYSVGKGFDTFQQVGVGVASALGGPVLGAIAGAAAGVFNRVFGMGARQAGDSGIRGTLGSAGVDLQSYSQWTQKGGFFRSDKSGTDTSAIGSELAQLLNGAVTSTTASTKAFAAALGQTSAAVDGFTQSVNINLKGLDAKQQEAAIGKALGDFANGMAEKILGTTKTVFTEVEKQITEMVTSFSSNRDDYGSVTSELVTRTVKGSASTSTYTPSEFTKTGETASQTLQRLAASLTAVNSTFEVLKMRLAEISLGGADAASKLIDAIGGVDKFAAATGAFYENFYTDAEKLSQKTSDIAKSLTDAGIATTSEQISKMTREQYRAMIESFGAVTAANAPMLAALYATSAAFASITPASQAAVTAIDLVSQTMRALTAETENLKISLLRAQGDSAGADSAQRVLDTVGYSSAEVAIYDYNKALQAQIDSLNSAAAAELAAGQERSALQAQLNDLTDTGAQALARQRDAVLANNRDIFDSIQVEKAAATARQEAAAALEKANQEATAALEANAAKAQQVAQEKLGLESQLLQLQGNTVELRRRELDSLAPANRGLQELIYSLQDAAQAATAAKETAANAGNSALQVLSSSLATARNGSKSALDAQIAIITAQKSASAQAFEAQKVAVSASMKASQSTAAKLSTLSSSLQSSIDGMSLVGNEGIDRSNGQQQINDALATARSGGGLPDADQLKQALSAVGKPSDQLFSSFADYQRDFLLTKNSLNDLNDITKLQQSAADQTVALLQTMLDSGQSQYDDLISSYDKSAAAAQEAYSQESIRLDATYELAQNQLAEALGTKIAVLSVVEAVTALQTSIEQITSANSPLIARKTAIENSSGSASNDDLKSVIAELSAQVAELSKVAALPVTLAADTSVPMVVQIINKQGVLQ